MLDKASLCYLRMSKSVSIQNHGYVWTTPEYHSFTYGTLRRSGVQAHLMAMESRLTKAEILARRIDAVTRARSSDDPSNDFVEMLHFHYFLGKCVALQSHMRAC